MQWWIIRGKRRYHLIKGYLREYCKENTETAKIAVDYKEKYEATLVELEKNKEIYKKYITQITDDHEKVNEEKEKEITSLKHTHGNLLEQFDVRNVVTSVWFVTDDYSRGAVECIKSFRK